MKALAGSMLLLAGVASAPAEASTWRVPIDFATINGALDASSPGDTVLVAPGVYDQHETRQLADGNFATAVAFLKGGVALVSELGSGWTTLRLDGELVGPSLCRAFGLVGVVTIDGFTLTGSAAGLGGVLFPYSELCLIQDCVFRDFGTGGSGGGVGVASTRADIEVRRSRFENLDGTSGAAIRQTSCTLIVEDCEFRSIRSGALSLTNDPNFPHAARLTMRRCRFFDNEKTTGSGGAVSVGYPQVLIEDCWFENNRSVGSSNGGGALSFGGATTNSRVLRDCTFVNNWVTTGKSGGVRVLSGSLEASGNTFIGNHQEIDWETGGSSVYLVGVNFDFRNNVIVGSTGDQAVGISSGTLATSCNVYWNNPLGHTSGFALDATDLVVDPLFCAPAAGDFHVDSTSLCLPQNNPSCGELIGAWEQGCGTVSVESESWGQIKERYRALPEETKP